ncbi:MAG: hypothetical protein KDC00_08710 [Flavobacteriales bacterium]|nr:hypothetical protein [Flavobacteriales bacterium]
MNARTLLLSTLIAFTGVHAQDDSKINTLFGTDKDMANGGWGAPSVHYTKVMGQDALLVGLRGGWLIDHQVTLGIAGFGLVTDVPNAAYDTHRIEQGHDVDLPSQFRMGYGGLFIEPILAHRSAVHVTLPVIIGAGGCGYQLYGGLPRDFDPYTYSDDAQAFFVIEPGVELELNLIPLVRLGVGASYRYTSDITLPGTPSDALRGINAGVTIKVGKF